MTACSKRRTPPAVHGVACLQSLQKTHPHFRRHACKRKARASRRYRLNAGETFVYSLSELCSRANASEVRNRLIRARRRQVLRAISACITAITVARARSASTRRIVRLELINSLCEVAVSEMP